MNVEERFMKYVEPEPNSGCWLWTGGIAWDGYGNFKVPGHQRQAHRIAYELWRGPIPDGLQLDHLCSVRSCVNPAHLEAVTGRTNVLRSEMVIGVNVVYVASILSVGVENVES